MGTRATFSAQLSLGIAWFSWPSQRSSRPSSRAGQRGPSQSQRFGCQCQQDNLSLGSCCCSQCTSRSQTSSHSARPSCCSCLSSQTVFRTIEVWYSSQEQLHAKPSDDQLVQLLQKIRVQHCTQPFVATVLGESPLAAKCFSARELRLACICSNAGGAQPKSMITAMDDADCPTLAKFPAWDKPKRPASAVTKLVLERELSLAVLKEQVETQQRHKEPQLCQLFTAQRLQGEEFYVILEVSSEEPKDDADASGTQDAQAADAVVKAPPFKVSMYAALAQGPDDMALRLVSCSITTVAVQQPAPTPDRRGRVVQPPRPGHVILAVTREYSSLGWFDFLCCGPVDSWAAFEAVLQTRKLVHPGDCLQFKVEVTELL